LVCCCINGVTHSDLSQSECESLGGISTLPSSCEGVDCCQYQNIGACCLSDGTCEPLTAYECSAKFGLYKGTGTSCNPNPCCLPTT
jgi:hypothetical protein